MSSEERKRQYLFERHSIDEVREWNRRLRYFRYFRAYGGHANDADSLDAAVAYRGEADLIRVLDELGIRPVRFAEEPPRPEAGVSYPYSEFSRFPSIVPGTRWIAQPGHTEIAGIPVFVWCQGDRVLISPPNGSWDVDESTVAAAEAIEPHLDRLAARILDPPREMDHYLCAAKHPELADDHGIPPRE